MPGRKYETFCPAFFGSDRPNAIQAVGEEQKWIRDIQRRGSRQAAVKTRYYRLMALLGLSVVLTLAACGFTVVLSQFSGSGIGWGKWLISGWKKDRTGS